MRSIVLALFLFGSPAGFAQERPASKPFFCDFEKSSDLAGWIVSDWNAPGSLPDRHRGVFEKSKVAIRDGHLVIALTQEIGPVGANPNGVISRCGEVQSRNRYGFGTYEWRARMSTTARLPSQRGEGVSGSVSALFSYLRNSETEIDIEVEGQYPWQLELVNWKNSDPTRPAKWPDDRAFTTSHVKRMATEFRTYKYVWSPDKIEFYVDGALVATSTTLIPQSPAYIMMSHWGIDSTDFGGPATVGVDRYLFIDWVRYTPLPE